MRGFAMSGKRFDPDRLSRLLEPYQFALNSPEYLKGEISFVRRSSSERLYEHLWIWTSNLAYVETFISGASIHSCHSCVSAADNRFRAFMAADARWQKSDLSTASRAKAWQERFIQNADEFCKSMAAEKGPVLAQRLGPLFSLVDSYIHALGNIFAVLDREYAFVTEISVDDQAEVERLTNESRRILYLNSEDARLAGAILVRFGSAIEGKDSPFRGVMAYKNNALAARLILLTDYVRASRFKYDTDRGLYR
jgi:hypothetical protein